MQEARLARSEAEQATALARAEAERCRELAGKLKEAARMKEEDRSDDSCGAVAQRWVPRTCSLCAASLCPVMALGDHQGAAAVRSQGAVGIQCGGGVIPRGGSRAVGERTVLSVPHPSLPCRRIEELTQELAASKRLVETLSAEKRNLQQRLEEPPAVGGQVGVQARGNPSPAPGGGAHPPRAWLALVIPVPFWGCGQGCTTSSPAELGI